MRSNRIPEQYPTIVQSWRRRWENVIPFFAFPLKTRRIIYATSIIESMHMERAIGKRVLVGRLRGCRSNHNYQRWTLTSSIYSRGLIFLRCIQSITLILVISVLSLCSKERFRRRDHHELRSVGFFVYFLVLKAAILVARYVDIDGAIVCDDRLSAGTVALVGLVGWLRIAVPNLRCSLISALMARSMIAFCKAR